MTQTKTSIQQSKLRRQQSYYYYAFGSFMGGRQYNSTSYRFGFNGKENDNEVKGVGNQVAFEARIYDARLGRWLSVDPLTDYYSSFSPYNFAFNSPIIFIDEFGEFPSYYNRGFINYKPKYVTKVFDLSSEFHDGTNQAGAPIDFNITISNITDDGITIGSFFNSPASGRRTISNSIHLIAIAPQLISNHSNSFGWATNTSDPVNQYDYYLNGNLISTHYTAPQKSEFDFFRFPISNIQLSDVFGINFNFGAGIQGNTDGCMSYKVKFRAKALTERQYYDHTYSTTNNSGNTYNRIIVSKNPNPNSNGISRKDYRSNKSHIPESYKKFKNNYTFNNSQQHVKP